MNNITTKSDLLYLNRMATYINAIGTAVPDHKILQENAAAWMGDALQANAREQKAIHSLYAASGIESRYSVLADYHNSKGSFTFFPNSDNLEPMPGTADRMKVYAREALPLAVKAVKDMQQGWSSDIDSITHLIVVSCTGMYAPGLDIELIESLGLQKNIERTCIQFMGCYAAINALRTGDHICRSNPEAKVLIACVELCTLHFQKQMDRDSLVSNALFGDGAAAMLLESKPGKGISYEIRSFYCDIAPDSKRDMAWQIGNLGFEMTLSSYVPKAIQNGIKELASKLLDRLNMQLNAIDRFAIHPGGRRILEACEEELGLTKEDNCFAYEVLSNYGNMSSPTVVFVLHNILKTLGPQDKGEQLLSFAFGPGLTMESMLLSIAANEA